MADKQKPNESRTPPAADPRAGRNPGYAETHPRDREDAHAKAPKPRAQPDEPGIDRDTDAQPDPAKQDKPKH
jgi:hypothetical protein